MTAGTVTRDGLEAMINGYLENSALYQLVLTLKNSPTPGIQQEETLTGDAAVTTTSLWGSHIWGGRLHHVPQDFAFPNSCSQIAWQYWMCGDRQKWYPPLRNLSRDDMPSTNMRNRLSDLRNLMQLVEKRAEEQRKWIANPSIEQANEMFEVGKDVLDISDVSEKGRKRRGLQMKWTSMVTRVRNKRTKKYLYNTKINTKMALELLGGPPVPLSLLWQAKSYSKYSASVKTKFHANGRMGCLQIDMAAVEDPYGSSIYASFFVLTLGGLAQLSCS
ncbi:hypothetical protein IV203_004207 [Nitzschia inconspicua]|uniref:Uncharacterized protein n=1 Tax=Nitzschia inconspicua TaxID=303405 RepID=A0A9K3PPX7_9STRA|nr:hypothetical protein IV203_004207 [Nitzschia inconspicua]